MTAIVEEEYFSLHVASTMRLVHSTVLLPFGETRVGQLVGIILHESIINCLAKTHFFRTALCIYVKQSITLHIFPYGYSFLKHFVALVILTAEIYNTYNSPPKLNNLSVKYF